MIVFVTYVMYQEERRVEFALEAEEQAQTEQARQTSSQNDESEPAGRAASPALPEATTAAEASPAPGSGVETPSSRSPVAPRPTPRSIALSTIEIGNGAIEARIGNDRVVVRVHRVEGRLTGPPVADPGEGVAAVGAPPQVQAPDDHEIRIIGPDRVVVDSLVPQHAGDVSGMSIS